MTKKKSPAKDLSTEEKIMEAARKVFMSKGYAATRTRDIAEEAGLNLALLNYYFRSKEKLFTLVMTEKMQHFFGFIIPIIYDVSTSLEAKLEAISSRYMDMLLSSPDLPFFVLGEARNNPGLIQHLVQRKDFLKNSVFLKQIREKVPDQDPYQYLLSFLGMCIFPFVIRPVFQNLTDTDDKKFLHMMAERKTLIPVWLKAILKAKHSI
jgi:AcrR family transcriptional regulator